MELLQSAFSFVVVICVSTSSFLLDHKLIGGRDCFDVPVYLWYLVWHEAEAWCPLTEQVHQTLLKCEIMHDLLILPKKAGYSCTKILWGLFEYKMGGPLNGRNMWKNKITPWPVLPPLSSLSSTCSPLCTRGDTFLSLTLTVHPRATLNTCSREWLDRCSLWLPTTLLILSDWGRCLVLLYL